MLLSVKLFIWLLTVRPGVVTTLSILMPVVLGCSRIDLNRCYICDDMFVFSYACMLLLGVSSRVMF